MCKKQTAVSHSSTESEIISLDTGLRLDGLPVLELWDLIIPVLGNISRVSDRSGKPESDDQKPHKSHNKIDVTRNIDAVPSNVQSARQEGVILVYMCVNLQMRLYVCQAPCPFWVQFGSSLGPFWVHFGSILGPFWVHFGSILGPFLVMDL